MDDLYANAWNDPDDAPVSDLKPSATTRTGWLSPKLPDAHEEADLAAPSWSTGAGIGWNEPSDSGGFSWGQADTDLAWGSTTYEDIQLGKSAAFTVEDATDVVESQSQKADGSTASIPSPSATAALPLASPTPDLVAEEVRETSPPPVQEVLFTAVTLADANILSPSVDQDGFGTFESALVPDEDTSVTLEASDVNPDTWGSAWASEQETEEQEAKVADEWEAARQRKAQHDLKVPPAVIAAMLRDTQQFCEDAWPESPSSDATDTEEWRTNWRRGLEGVEGLEALVNTFLPPLSLQPPIKFGKTSMGKRMAASVRQTKNMTMSKRSPMSYYLAAKGSTAWEVAVKERKEVAGDEMPVGWRILEKDVAGDVAARTVAEKKPAGRLFSFWGRRDSSSTHTRTSSQSDVKGESSSRSPTSSENVGHSRRPSRESVVSVGFGSTNKSTPPARQSSSSPTPSANVSTTSISPPSHLQSASYAEAPELQADPNSVQAPSAVSRFLNRFSRRPSSVGSSSPRNSLALSSDDFDFLAEIPSANDGDDDEDMSLKTFESVFNSQPQSSALPPLLPPPLPPPPSANTCSPTAGIHSPINTLNSAYGLLDSTSFMAAPAVAASSSNAVPSQPVTTIPVLQPSRPASPSVGLPRGSRSTSPSPLSVERKAAPAQPFFLPSPPSSRSHTPTPAMRSTFGDSEPGRSQTPPVTQAAVRGNSSVKHPPPLFPPPRAAAGFPDNRPNPPDTPTSGMPLAQLYPDAYRAQTDKGAMSRPASRAQTSTPFIPPPPPARSDSTHVGMLPPLLAPPPPLSRQSSAPPLIPPPAPSIAPATILPAPSRQSTVSPLPSVPVKPSGPPKPLALSIASLDDDDDEEFSDFLSSATVPTSSKPLVRSISSSSRSSTPNKTPPSSLGRSGGRAPALAHLRIGSSSRKSGSGTPAPPPKLSLLDDSDDFSDFQASPAAGQPPSSKPFSDDPFSSYRPLTTSQPLQSWPSQSQSTGSFDSATNDSVTSDKTFLTPRKDLGFDFLGSYTSPLSTPSPPRPIAKAPRISAPSSSSSKPHTLSTQSVADASSTRASKAASHLHTLSLMEKAASRPGRWPAPPSPLPQAIPGPDWAPASTAAVDLLGDDGSPDRPKVGGVSASHSSPALLDPFKPASTIGNMPVLPVPSLLQSQSSQSLQSASLSSLQRMGSPPTVSHPVMAPGVNSSSKQSTAKPGGLSAQDLMFFEGL